MRLHIDHITTFTYDALISEAYTEMRLRPMDAGGQRCLSFTLVTEPRGEVAEYRDFRGNDVRYFDVLQPHRQLVVSAASDVLTPDRFIGDGAEPSPLERFDYLTATPLTPQLAAICEGLAPRSAAADPYGTALGLMHAVHQALTYEKGATAVTTTAAEALALGRGVCQDFAHVMLAAARCLGIPARYVSGYLLSRSAASDDAATHAWADLFVPGRGWVALDPTHDTEQTPHHVRVAVGRDYADVPPTRGIYTGNAHETLSVKVRLCQL